jgi:HEPN domain-containing protein
MGKSLVTETPDELISNAERDIMTVKVLISKKFHPADLMYNVISFHSTQAVEKLLKSYIIGSGKDVEKTHDLDDLQQTAMKIDASFAEIRKDCVTLNEFVPNVKYSDQAPITNQNIKKIIKSLEAVCNFPPIKALRDSFNKKHKYRIIAEEVAGSGVKKTANPKKKKSVRKKQ